MILSDCPNGLDKPNISPHNGKSQPKRPDPDGWGMRKMRHFHRKIAALPE